MLRVSGLGFRVEGFGFRDSRVQHLKSKHLPVKLATLVSTILKSRNPSPPTWAIKVLCTL